MRKFGTDGVRAEINFLPEAFGKMAALIHSVDTEVAWHAVVTRIGYTFFVDDIIVYPQYVTGVTVDTDQERYTKWLMDLDDETGCNLLGQMHSHVNMSCSPSTTDKKYMTDISKTLPEDGFYLFMIWNKRFEHFATIYDRETGVIFENEDIDITFDEPEDLKLVEHKPVPAPKAVAPVKVFGAPEPVKGPEFALEDVFSAEGDSSSHRYGNGVWDDFEDFWVDRRY